MLCVLGNDSAELLGFERNIDRFAHFCGFAYFLRVLEQDIGIGIFDLLNHIFCYVYFDLFFFRIYIAVHDILAAVIVLCGNHDRRGDLFIKVIRRDILFLHKKPYCLKKILIHFPINLSVYLLKSFISKSSSFTNDVSFF